MSRANKLYTLIKEIFLLLDDGDRQLLSQYNLTVPRFYALFHLGDQPGLTVSQLSDKMFCDKSNITRLMKGLEAEELVMRQPHESDGRALRLFLTPAGQSLRSQVLSAHQQRNRQRFDHCMNMSEQDQLMACLFQVKDSLETDIALMEAT